MSYTEKVFSKILEITKENDIDIVEAASIFCEECDIDVETFIKSIDSGLLEQLKYTAIQEHKVRSSTYKPARQIKFEYT